MASPPKRIYWDACAWIAHIQQEKILNENGTVKEDRGAMCALVISAAEKSAIELVTSALSLAEVCKSKDVTEKTDQQIADFMETDYILLANVDRHTGVTARRLMLKGHKGLKPPDALHIAGAIVSRCDEFHTFDGKLLDLNGSIQTLEGGDLPIVKPKIDQPPAPLLEHAENDKDKNDQTG